jgi:hypothetical protein
MVDGVGDGAAAACSGTRKTCDDASSGRTAARPSTSNAYVLDGGSIVLADAGCGPIATCNVTKQMIRRAVLLRGRAGLSEGPAPSSISQRRTGAIDCTHESDIDAGPCFASVPALCIAPVGAFAHACVWQPPLLIP